MRVLKKDRLRTVRSVRNKAVSGLEISYEYAALYLSGPSNKYMINVNSKNNREKCKAC